MRLIVRRAARSGERIIMRHHVVVALTALGLIGTVLIREDGWQRSIEAASMAPAYEVDPSWPKRDGNWMLGQIGGLAIDPTNDHVWVLQRPRTLENDETYAAQHPPLGDCCVAARPVMEFDPAGKLVQ